METDFINFINSCPTQYHFCEFAKNKLSLLGFEEISETDFSSGKMPKKGFMIRDDRSFVAYRINGYESICGCGLHCDCPCFKLPNNYEIDDGNQKIIRLNFYGNGKWCDYLDRELKVAGKVIYKDENKNQSTKLVNSKKGIAIITNINENIKRIGTYDKKKSFNAIIGKTCLKKYIAENLIGCKAEDILNWDLQFTEAFEPIFIDDNISSSSLFTLGNSYAGLNGFINANEETNSVQIIGFFDSQQTANNNSKNSSNSDLFKIIIDSIFKDKDLLNIKANSLLISSQLINAFHPNFKSETADICPIFGKGTTLNNSKPSYVATEVFGNGIINKASQEMLQNIQVSTSRNTGRGSATIGISLALKNGIRTVDIGTPIIGSCRESMNFSDILSLSQIIQYIYSNPSVYSTIKY